MAGIKVVSGEKLVLSAEWRAFWSFSYTGHYLRHAKLGQNTESGFGVEEGDELAAGAVEGLVVDEFYAGAGSLKKLTLDVVGTEGDMMDAAGGVFFEELGDGTVRAGGFQEFKVDAADGKEGGADFLRGDFFAPLAFEAEGLFIIRDSLIE
jgi:hypothetical protein